MYKIKPPPGLFGDSWLEILLTGILFILCTAWAFALICAELWMPIQGD